MGRAPNRLRKHLLFYATQILNAMEAKLKRVLLIDDDPITNFLHAVVLKETGFTQQVETVETVSDALDLLANAQANRIDTPELIFLDLNMPGLNGWDFMEEYQKRQEKVPLSSVIVVLTTSLNPDDTQKASRIREIAEFRNKPLTDRMVRDIVQKYFHP